MNKEEEEELKDIADVLFNNQKILNIPWFRIIELNTRIDVINNRKIYYTIKFFPEKNIYRKYDKVSFKIQDENPLIIAKILTICVDSGKNQLEIATIDCVG